MKKKAKVLQTEKGISPKHNIKEKQQEEKGKEIIASVAATKRKKIPKHQKG